MLLEETVSMRSTSINQGEAQFHVQRSDVPRQMRRNGIVYVAGRLHGKDPSLQVDRLVSVIQG